ADSALTETSKRNELLLDSSRDAIAYITDGMHIYANHAYMELFGYEDSKELECMPIMDLIDTNEHDKFKQYLKTHSKNKNDEDFSFNGLNVNGDTFEAFLSLTDLKYDGEDCTQVYIKTAVGNNEELAKKLRELSDHDRLTGLYNRHHLINNLDESIAHVADNKLCTSILYIELDNFSNIQDEYGITQCNQYVKDASAWLLNTVASNEMLARIGDSTFAVLTETNQASDAETLGKNLCEKFSEHLFEIADITIKDTLSIGVSLISETSADSETVLSNAHFAASRVQSSGGNAVRVHDHALESLDNREDAEIAMEIQDAIDADLIHVMYDPIVKLHGKVQQIFHARLAITTEEGEYQDIKDAFKIGHRTSTAFNLDNFLMTESFKTFSEYLPEHKQCKLKIRLSAASLLNENIVSNILDLLSQNNLSGNSVIFEFSEKDSVVHLKRVIEITKQMSLKNLIIGLYGFGSTLDSEYIVETLCNDSFSWVSLDEKLFNNFSTDGKAQQKVKELLKFAHVHELITIAPCISDAGSMAIIWPMNVHHIQGEYIGVKSEKMVFDFSHAAF
ncbi:MAG: diguanylate cyclase, partial [Gammaproteobacteria bacterium]|nr:diguanylate cyclase [Gammaproteobacteria bacterium]